MDLLVGWNAVYLEVDASYEKLDHLPDGEIPAAIQEIWRWEPDDSAARFFRSPNQPYVSDGSPWVAWKRDGTQNELEKLIGAHAYLVKSDAEATWNLKGRPMPPDVLWTSDGVNLLGFPTPPGASPSLTDFLEPEPFLRQNLKVYAYQGPVDPIPSQLWSFDDVEIVRGQAYWFNAPGVFSRFYGPYHLELQDHTGVHFGDSLSQYRIRLRNLTDAELTVTLRFVDSEAAPDVTNPSEDKEGNVTVKPLPVTQLGTVIVRGDPLESDPTRYGVIRIGRTDEGGQNRGHEITIAEEGKPGSVVEVVLGVDRKELATMDASASGGLFSGILRLTDSLGLTQIDLPVTAAQTDTSGLWVGEARINRVQHMLNTYAMEEDEDGNKRPRTVELTDLDLQTAPSADQISESDESGARARSRLILALIGDELHFRVLDSLGNRVVDISEEALEQDASSAQAGPSQADYIRARVTGPEIKNLEDLSETEKRAIIDDTLETLDLLDTTDLTASSLDLQAVDRIDDISETDVSGIQAVDRLILALIGDELHFRVLDAQGDRVVNISEEALEQTSLAHPELTQPDDIRVRVTTGPIIKEVGDLSETEKEAIIEVTLETLNLVAKGDLTASSLDFQTVDSAEDISESDDSGMQAVDRLILALIGDELHFRVLDTQGNRAVDVSEETLYKASSDHPELTQPNAIRTWVTTWPRMMDLDHLSGSEERAIIDETLEFLGQSVDEFTPEVPGTYILTGRDTSMGTVARAFPIRLILHQGPDDQPARLLQQVFYQIDSQGVGLLTTEEEDLEQDRLDQARRISCAHLPWSGSTKSWVFNGPVSVSTGAAVITIDEPPVVSRFDAHENNPFLHTYHPDHDNLSLSDDPNNPGQVLRQPITAAGEESYTIERTISLSFDAPGSDFEALTRATDRVFGTYSETLSILGAPTENEGVTLLLEGSAATEDERNEGKPTGGFELQRISVIDTLETP